MVFPFLPVEPVPSSNYSQFTKLHFGGHSPLTKFIHDFILSEGNNLVSSSCTGFVFIVGSQNQFRPFIDWLPLRNVMWWLQGAFTSECKRPWTDCVSIRSSAYRCMVGKKIALLPTDIKSIKCPMRRKDTVMSLHQIRSSPEQKATSQCKVFLTVMQCFSVRSRLSVPSFPVNCLPLPSLVFFHPGAFSTSARVPLSVLILMRRLTSLSNFL